MKPGCERFSVPPSRTARDISGFPLLLLLPVALLPCLLFVFFLTLCALCVKSASALLAPDFWILSSPLTLRTTHYPLQSSLCF